MKYLSSIKEELDRLKVNYSGCSQSEINEVKNQFNDEVPKCYIEFLEEFGRGMLRDKIVSKGFLQGSTVFYPYVLDLTASLRDDLKHYSALRLPESSFVFYDSQGILNAFFRLDDGDNPKIY